MSGRDSLVHRACLQGEGVGEETNTIRETIEWSRLFQPELALGRSTNEFVHLSLKGQYRHDQSSLSTGHGIGVLV